MLRKNPATQKKPEEDIPIVLIATRVPLCHVLVRFFPRMVIPTFSSSSFRFGFGWVMAWDGACDTNTVGAELWTPERYKCTNKWISMMLLHKIWYKDHHILYAHRTVLKAALKNGSAELLVKACSPLGPTCSPAGRFSVELQRLPLTGYKK